jgi:hypothetical protein
VRRQRRACREREVRQRDREHEPIGERGVAHEPFEVVPFGGGRSAASLHAWGPRGGPWPAALRQPARRDASSGRAASWGGAGPPAASISYSVRSCSTSSSGKGFPIAKPWP